MDFEDTREEAAFRAEVRAFLDEHAPKEGLRHGDLRDMQARVARQRAWQRVLHEHGFGAPSWPAEWGGRGFTAAQSAIWRQECGRSGVDAGVLSAGLSMLGPALIAHADDDLKRRFLEPTARGDIMWAQLFSEPGAGSDLASLATRAVRDGADWIVNGQKVWSSFADHADWGFLLVRSDPRAPKHRGISFLLLDMKSPGVEVRPLVEMTGGSHFNEVFLSDVRVPDAQRVGPPGGGWAVARTVLMFERSSIGSFSALDTYEKLAALCAERGGADAASADEIAQLYAWAKGLDLLGKRVQTKLSRGEIPGAEGSVMKNAIAELMLRGAALGMRLLGEEALAADSPCARDFLFAPSMHLGGGSEEIMKNLVAEQVLGLPREPDGFRGRPFDEIPRGQVGE